MAEQRNILRIAVAVVFAFSITAPKASALNLENLIIGQMEDHFDGVSGPNPFGLEVLAFGTGISTITFSVNGVGDNSLTLDGDEWFFEDLGYASLAALRVPYATGNFWAFTFNEGLGDEDTVTINYNPNAMPTGLITGMSPAHGATAVPLNPTLTWDDCSACGADNESLMLIEMPLDQDVDFLRYVATSTTNWSPVALAPGTLHEIEAALNGRDSGSGLTATVGGDAFFYDGQTERINITSFTTVVPEPSTALLLGMGMVFLSAQRRKGE